MITRKYRPDEVKKEIVKEWLEVKGTVQRKEFCAAHEICGTNLRQWVKKFGKEVVCSSDTKSSSSKELVPSNGGRLATTTALSPFSSFSSVAISKAILEATCQFTLSVTSALVRELREK